MRTNILFTFLFLFGTLASWSQRDIQESVYFHSGQHALTPEALNTLNALVEKAPSWEDYSIQIFAHTDSEGDTKYNDRLAQNRAKSVQQFLTQQGIAVDKTTFEAFGEKHPSFSNASEEGRRQNRRVDIRVSVFSWDSLDDLMGKLKRNTRQFYEIEGDRNYQITAENGTKVWIDAHSFTDANGNPVSGAIQIEMEEAYSYEDMILSGLSTTSGDRLLETGGMVYIHASSNGQSLQLNPGSEMIVSMPTPELKDGMQLFAGQTDASGNIDWAPTQQRFGQRLQDYINMPKMPVKPAPVYNPPKYKKDLSDKPQEPIHPRKPHQPRKPKRESVQYNPGLIKRITLGKEKIESKEEDIFEKKMNDYERRVTRYEQKMKEYEQAVVQYQQDKVIYENRLAEWEARIAADRVRFEPGGEVYEAYMEEHRKKLSRIDEVYAEKIKEWEALRNEQIERFEVEYEKAGLVTQNDMKEYFYQVQRLGWINCDRFYDVPRDQRTPMVINDPDTEEEMVYVIFEDINSIIKTTRKNVGYITSPLPLNREVKILGIKVKEGRARMAVEDTVIGSVAAVDLDYRPCRLKDIREQLQRL
jgi:hypothetical protein